MANGRFRKYYWDIRTFIAQNDDITHLENYSSEDQVINAGLFKFKLVFDDDGSELIAIANLRSNDEIIEYDYYYCYTNSRNERVFSYDDRPHHPEIETHPHHIHRGPKPESGSGQAQRSDLNPVSFFAVFQKICDRIRS